MNQTTTPAAYRRRLRAYLELMRPPNILTAFADVLAGFAIAGGHILFTDGALEIAPGSVGWLLLSTFGLYGGGVVFNDYFDADLDARERPERPIPSGRISRIEAGILGSILLFIGLVAAFTAHLISGALATGIVVFVLLYDAVAKQSAFWGPLVMGSCRGGNLLLGVSASPLVVFELGFLALLPVVYIAAITLVSRGEVHGGSNSSGWTGTALIVIVIASLLSLHFIPGFDLLRAGIFILLFAGTVLPPFFRASYDPAAEKIQAAVKRGVLSLIILNSALAAGFSGPVLGFLILILLPVSLLLSRLFAVT